MRLAQTDYELTAEEEAQMELEYHLNAIRWPVEDDGYLEALDAAFTALREAGEQQMESV
jgi:hypothetical protein